MFHTIFKTVLTVVNVPAKMIHDMILKNMPKADKTYAAIAEDADFDTVTNYLIDFFPGVIASHVAGGVGTGALLMFLASKYAIPAIKKASSEKKAAEARRLAEQEFIELGE